MKEFIIKEGEGELLIHMTASNENYTISYDRGQLIFQNINKTYIIPKNLGHKIIYDKLDTLTNKNKYQVEDIRTLYRDTTPTDFGISNKTNVSPGSKHTSEEIIVGGINDYIPVVAPAGVKIYVNGNIVGSGTMIYNGDRVKFELIAPASSGTNSNYNLRVGDISKNVSLETSNIVLPISPTTLTYYGYESGTITFSDTIYLVTRKHGHVGGVNIDLNDLTNPLYLEFTLTGNYTALNINEPGYSLSSFTGIGFYNVPGAIISIAYNPLTNTAAIALNGDSIKMYNPSDKIVIFTGSGTYAGSYIKYINPNTHNQTYKTNIWNAIK